MCCGETAAQAVVPREVMVAKVYATVPGAEVQVGTYGVATNEEGVEVPDKVAAEYARMEGFRVEGEWEEVPPEASAPDTEAEETPRRRRAGGSKRRRR